MIDDFDVFISYKSEERALPAALAKDLEQKGYTVWWDVELVGGPSFREQIMERLNAARAVIVIWTPGSVQAAFVLDEADHAKRDNKLIPVRVPELEIHDIPLGHRQAQTYLLSQRQRIFCALAALGVRPEETTDPQPESREKLSEPAPFDERALELQWWERIKDRDDPTMLSEFLERFPDGVFVPLGKDRLAELEWQSLKNTLNTKEIEKFLKRWPGSRFEEPARKRPLRIV